MPANRANNRADPCSTPYSASKAAMTKITTNATPGCSIFTLNLFMIVL